MARAPALIRRRGKSWNVVIRLDGVRHEFGPRSEPFLGKASTKKHVEEWVWRKHAELRDEAKRAVEREVTIRPNRSRSPSWSRGSDRRSWAVPSLHTPIPQRSLL